MSFFWHKNTIQELSLILVSDFADLRDLGADEGDESDINSFEDDLILELWAHSDCAAWEHVDLLDLFSS